VETADKPAAPSRRLRVVLWRLLFGVVILLLAAMGIGLVGLWALQTSQPKAPTEATKRSAEATPVGVFTPIAKAISGPFVRVAFANQQLGLIAYDGLIRRTTDAGGKWSTAYTGKVPVHQLQWVGADIAYALTYTNILESEDAGAGWQVVSSTSDISRIDFLDGSTGYAVKNGQLLFTNDSGRSFDVVTTPMPVQAVEFLSPAHGWVVGPTGIAATSDGGKSWVRQATFPYIGIYVQVGAGHAPDPKSPAWNSVHFYDRLHGFVFYAIPETTMSERPSYVFYTADGGLNWRLQSAQDYAPELALPAAQGHTPSWVGGDLVVTSASSAQVLDSARGGEQPTLAVTTDAGVTWTQCGLPEALHPGPIVDGAIAVVGEREWVIWLDFNRNLARLVMTTDAGSHWAFQSM
jgi:photosystem II stability/assembly factor-like uncharacterized protein